MLSEIVTSLHYLREDLIYRQGVHHMEPMGQNRSAWREVLACDSTGARYRCHASRPADAESAAMLDAHADVQPHELSIAVGVASVATAHREDRPHKRLVARVLT